MPALGWTRGQDRQCSGQLGGARVPSIAGRWGASRKPGFRGGRCVCACACLRMYPRHLGSPGGVRVCPQDVGAPTPDLCPFPRGKSCSTWVSVCLPNTPCCSPSLCCARRLSSRGVRVPSIFLRGGWGQLEPRRPGHTLIQDTHTHAGNPGVWAFHCSLPTQPLSSLLSPHAAPPTPHALTQAPPLYPMPPFLPPQSLSLSPAALTGSRGGCGGRWFAASPSAARPGASSSRRTALGAGWEGHCPDAWVSPAREVGWLGGCLGSLQTCRGGVAGSPDAWVLPPNMKGGGRWEPGCLGSLWPQKLGRSEQGVLGAWTPGFCPQLQGPDAWVLSQAPGGAQVPGSHASAQPMAGLRTGLCGPQRGQCEMGA